MPKEVKYIDAYDYIRGDGKQIKVPIHTRTYNKKNVNPTRESKQLQEFKRIYKRFFEISQEKDKLANKGSQNLTDDDYDRLDELDEEWEILEPRFHEIFSSLSSVEKKQVSDQYHHLRTRNIIHGQ